MGCYGYVEFFLTVFSRKFGFMCKIKGTETRLVAVDEEGLALEKGLTRT